MKHGFIWLLGFVALTATLEVFVLTGVHHLFRTCNICRKHNSPMYYRDGWRIYVCDECRKAITSD